MTDEDYNKQMIKDAYRAKREQDIRVRDPIKYNIIKIARGSKLPIGPVRVETIDCIERVIIQSKINYE